MKLFQNIMKFISAIRWYMAGNRVDECSVKSDFYRSFAKEHESEFSEYRDNLILNEIKESFEFFNGHFLNNEVAMLIRSMNEHESKYRNRYSNSWLSHGELSYKPYFRCEQSPKYLTLYFYLIALNMGDIDFYPSNDEFDDTNKLFVAESMMNEPSYLELINGKYSVTSDFKVKIK